LDACVHFLVERKSSRAKKGDGGSLAFRCITTFSNASKAICTFLIGVKKQIRVRAYSESGS